jgi:hypothetical protein
LQLFDKNIILKERDLIKSVHFKNNRSLPQKIKLRFFSLISLIWEDSHVKTIVQLYGNDLKKVPDTLRKIADEIEKGKVGSSCLEDGYCYDYLIEEESYYRKFLVYSNDEIIDKDGEIKK